MTDKELYRLAEKAFDDAWEEYDNRRDAIRACADAVRAACHEYAAALEAENKLLRETAICGWETARLIAICPPTFGAPASEKAADEALAYLRAVAETPAAIKTHKRALAAERKERRT